MSVETHKKNDTNDKFEFNEDLNSKKVNLNDLVKRMQDDEKKQRKSNLILSAAAISAAAVFGIILTL